MLNSEATSPPGFFAKAYSAFGVLLLIALLAQLFFIAVGILHPAGATAKNIYALHGINGTFVIPITIILLILLSFAARHPWRSNLLTALLLLLLVLQFDLTLISFGSMTTRIIQGFDDLVLVSLTLWLARKRWAF